ncbi:MAG TPA: PIN domain-containing protein [bacterium]|nr:PIN domain-containing protein [bacterium]
MTSKHGEKAAGPIAADANVLLSAVTGKAALRVFIHSNLKIATTASILEEVREYLPVMAEKYGVPFELLESQLQLLALHVYNPRDYQVSLMKARHKMEKRDPDDADLLALAYELGIPIWSNDDDFNGVGVERFTTAQLLKNLGF